VRHNNLVCHLRRASIWHGDCELHEGLSYQGTRLRQAHGMRIKRSCIDPLGNLRGQQSEIAICGMRCSLKYDWYQCVVTRACIRNILDQTTQPSFEIRRRLPTGVGIHAAGPLLTQWQPRDIYRTCAFAKHAAH